jgi:hypothetical protein
MYASRKIYKRTQVQTNLWTRGQMHQAATPDHQPTSPPKPRSPLEPPVLLYNPPSPQHHNCGHNPTHYPYQHQPKSPTDPRPLFPLPALTFKPRVPVGRVSSYARPELEARGRSAGQSKGEMRRIGVSGERRVNVC